MTEQALVLLLGRLREGVKEHRGSIADVVAALAADGRAFAATPEGRRWRQVLESSALLPRVRLLWDGLGLGGLGGQAPEGPPPSELARILVALAKSPRLETLLSALPLLGAQ